MSELLLSICIPTNGASQWVIPVLDSIYSQHVPEHLFEVVVADNGENSTLSSELALRQYGNLRYVSTGDKGFLNLVTSLKLGRGVLRKMLNHRSIMLPGSINRWLEIAGLYKDSQPVLYFSDGQLGRGGLIECADVDALVRTMSYWCSWSAGLSVWEKDIEYLDKVEVDEMFPNTSLLFDLRKESSFVVIDEKYQHMLDDSGKGGYPLFHTFGITFLDLLTRLRYEKRICIGTFMTVKRDIYRFLRRWYTLVHTQHYSFTPEDIKEAILVYYSAWDYYKLCVRGNIGIVRYKVAHCLRRVLHWVRLQ